MVIVSRMPGFVSIKDFSAQDGESLALVEFDSLASVDAWKAHPEHLVAQRRGRKEFFADYRIQVCNLIRASEFTAESQTPAPGQLWKPRLDLTAGGLGKLSVSSV
jgi:heme-degrading monooxygenase HmoA